MARGITVIEVEEEVGGGPIVGRVTAFCSNHKHNRALLRAIEAEKMAELQAS